MAGWAPSNNYDGSSSDPFPIKSGVKQGCVLAPTQFGIFFSLLLRYASTNQKIVSSSTPEAMATCSTYQVSEHRQRCIECSLERCSLQTMPPSPHTPKKLFSDSSDSPSA
ncbi:hypothetical protein RRG08_021959 [Elysia crispata]|uniref:Reverse transcriptase domain-containing protein n=1 Tax=Elysia crispata TaxID=231223 RepID=A0AAE1DWP9_9GAST|nr:hypothetical protein RRG08_021959 [Elysia crispata]